LSLLSDTPGFATGGSFRVGGPGGIDKALMNFQATKGEYIGISKADPAEWGQAANDTFASFGRAQMRQAEDHTRAVVDAIGSLDRRMSALERATRAQGAKKIVVKK
jgi:hypothetical protein